MSKAEPTVQRYMTAEPCSIAPMDSLEKARSMMAQRKIRHLPVVDQGEVVGVLSDRDIKLACGIDGVDPAKLPAINVCSSPAYTVDPDSLLSDVVSEMAEKHYGSAVVVQNSKLVGIFTTVDACRALAEVLRMRFHTH